MNEPGEALDWCGNPCAANSLCVLKLPRLVDAPEPEVCAVTVLRLPETGLDE